MNNVMFMYFPHRNGLANRLRSLAAFMIVTEKLYNTSNVIAQWQIVEACNGHFLEVFQPLDDVLFVNKWQRPRFTEGALATFDSVHTFSRILDSYNLLKFRYLEQEKYKLFKPTDYLLDEVHRFVLTYGICHCVGVHIRHTDLDRNSYARADHSSDNPFFEFIDSFSSTQCVYLMTDNALTQKKFRGRYGSRLYTYTTIKNSTTPQHQLSNNHRFTSFFHTLVDVLISAFTYEFKGSRLSSLSAAVRLFNNTLVSNSDVLATCLRNGRHVQ